MLNILEYMQILLKLLTLSHIYRQLLNKPNMIYSIALIGLAGFKDLIFVISYASAISNILKILIFVNLIDVTTEIVKYLQSKLSKCIKTTKQLDMIILAFSIN